MAYWGLPPSANLGLKNLILICTKFVFIQLQNLEGDVGQLTKFCKSYMGNSSPDQDFDKIVSPILLSHIQKNDYIPHMYEFTVQALFLLTNYGLYYNNCPIWLVERVIDQIRNMDIDSLNLLKLAGSLVKKFSKNKSTNYYQLYQKAFMSRLITLIMNDASNLQLSNFTLFTTFIRWSNKFDEKEIEMVNESGFIKLATGYCTNATEALCVLAKSLQFDRLHYPELLELCIDCILQSDGNVHTCLLMHITYAMFANTYAKIDEDKKNQFLSLTASCFLRDFDAMSGNVLST